MQENIRDERSLKLIAQKLKTTVVFRTTEQQETVKRDYEWSFMGFFPPLLLYTVVYD